MDIQAEKHDLIEWVTGIKDARIINQLKIIQKSLIDSSLTSEEKAAIDEGLASIASGKTHTHEAVMESTKKKFPGLFK